MNTLLNELKKLIRKVLVFLLLKWR